jgi:hypothetical protein
MTSKKITLGDVPIDIRIMNLLLYKKIVYQ